MGKNLEKSTFNQMKYTNKINLTNTTFHEGYFWVDCEQCGDTLKIAPDLLEVKC